MYGELRSVVVRHVMAGKVGSVIVRWGRFGYGQAGEVSCVMFGFGNVRYGRLGMVIMVRCGVVSYNLKFLPNSYS